MQFNPGHYKSKDEFDDVCRQLNSLGDPGKERIELIYNLGKNIWEFRLIPRGTLWDRFWEWFDKPVTRQDKVITEFIVKFYTANTDHLDKNEVAEQTLRNLSVLWRNKPQVKTIKKLHADTHLVTAAEIDAAKQALKAAADEHKRVYSSFAISELEKAREATAQAEAVAKKTLAEVAEAKKQAESELDLTRKKARERELKADQNVDAAEKAVAAMTKSAEASAAKTTEAAQKLFNRAPVASTSHSLGAALLRQTGSMDFSIFCNDGNIVNAHSTVLNQLEFFKGRQFFKGKEEKGKVEENERKEEKGKVEENERKEEKVKAGIPIPGGPAIADRSIPQGSLDFDDYISEGVNIPGFDSNTVQTFVNYLYTGKIELIDLAEILNLYRLADLIDYPELQENCSEALDSILDNNPGALLNFFIAPEAERKVSKEEAAKLAVDVVKFAPLQPFILKILTEKFLTRYYDFLFLSKDKQEQFARILHDAYKRDPDPLLATCWAKLCLSSSLGYPADLKVMKELSDNPYEEGYLLILKLGSDNYPPALEVIHNLYKAGKIHRFVNAADFQVYQKQAEKNPFMQALLGDCYQRGLGIEKNNKEAINLFEKSAKEGNLLGQLYLGNCYHHGIGVSEDKPRAELIFKSIELSAALNNLGIINRAKGEKELGFTFINKAAKHSAVALNNLGFFYEMGIGTKIDQEQAIRNYNKAAIQGQPDAISVLTDAISEFKLKH